METSAARIFFAARPDAAALDALVACQQRLKREPWQRHVRWTDRENLHMTLKFLGQTRRESIAAIVSHVRKTLVVPRVYFHIDSTALFPNKRRPNVVAATIKDNDSLSQLAKSLDTISEHFGYKPEKRTFKPHITIGRCRKGFPRGVDLPGHFEEPVPAWLDEIILYESVTHPEGARYTEVASFGDRRGQS